MSQEIQSPDHSDEQLNYKQFMELNKETKGKRGKPGKTSKQAQTLKQQAMKLLINGDFKECHDKLMEIITLDPKNYQPYFMMGQIYQQNRDKEKAAHYYSLSAELSPPDPRKWEKIGDLYKDVQFHQQAAYCYGRCLKSEPLNGEVLKKRAQAYQRGGQYKKAIAVYYKMLRINTTLNIIKDCAKLHCRLSQFQKAREILRQAPSPDQNIVYMVCQTLLREGRYSEVIEEVEKNVLMYGQVELNSVMVEFLKMMFISAMHLESPQAQKYLSALLENLNEQSIDVFEDILTDLSSSTNANYGIRILQSIIADKTLVKKPEHYLALSDLYQKNNWLGRATEVLQRGSKIFVDNKNIRSQLGFIKIKTGKEKEGVALVKESESEEEIYISDLSQDEKPLKVSDILRSAKVKEIKPVPPKKVRKQSETFIQDQTLGRIQKSIENLHELLTLKKEDPQILTELFSHLQSLLKDVSIYTSKLKFQSYNDDDSEQKRGLFSRKSTKKRRRNKAQQKTNLNEQKLVQIIHTWISLVFPLSCWNKIFVLSGIVSKLQLLKRFPKERQRIYQLCIVACIQLKRYRRALFLLKYLLHKDASNILYILLCNVLVRRINSPNTCKFILSKLSQYSSKHPNLNYLIAFEHLQSGYFEHSIKSLIKLPVTKHNQQMVSLCLASCFVQLASSRNTTNKLSMVNRATYMLDQYKATIQSKDSKSFQLFHNLGRFYHQLHLTSKAIEYYKKALFMPIEPSYTSRTAYSLLCLYREIEDWDSYNLLSREYFCI